MKCDKCNKAAVVHEVIVKAGVRREIHLCGDHAQEAGIDLPTPINQLLTHCVIAQAGRAAGQTAKACPTCGLTFSEFRHNGVLGCSDCYTAFQEQLSPLIERAQNGGTHHSGKTPRRAGGSLDRQLQIRQLVKELDDAVAAEQYERAAKLRDRLMSLEVKSTSSSTTQQPAPPSGA
jgi:protein arginine kinase activator